MLLKLIIVIDVVSVNIHFSNSDSLSSVTLLMFGKKGFICCAALLSRLTQMPITCEKQTAPCSLFLTTAKAAV